MRIKHKLQDSEFQELARPKLKLFMSVDIVGSTHFKQRDIKGPNQNWLGLFISFFTEFPSLIKAEIASLDARLDQVRLWKSLGDELIFTVELKSRASAALYVKALSQALRKAARNWHTDPLRPDRKELHLKGAAWLVGFPVGNVEIPLFSSTVSDDDDGTSPVPSDDRDYIGPLVDMGFRLKEHASSRKLALSADLAYLMLATGSRADMVLFYEGEFPLKGVLRGKAYPIVWLDCDGHPEREDEVISAKMHRLKDELESKTAPHPNKLLNYLKLWLQGVKDCPCIPFIKQDPSEDFKPAPDFERRLEDAVTHLKKLFYEVTPEDEPGAGGSGVPPEVDSMIESIAEISEKTGRSAAKPKKSSAKKAASKTARKKGNK